MKGDLKVTNIKFQFNKHMKDDFVCFDGRQRINCIRNFIEKEMDLDYFYETGIIKEHYPLHRLEIKANLEKQIGKYTVELINSLAVNSMNWIKLIQPINYIKRYSGERFAFYFMYFINFQALLIVPGLLGIALSFWQYYNFGLSHNMQESLDSSWNGAFGLFLTFWASYFVENWKKKENKLIQIWDLNTISDVSLNDERKGQFTYQQEYNS